jgi:hypothetical protein
MGAGTWSERARAAALEAFGPDRLKHVTVELWKAGDPIVFMFDHAIDWSETAVSGVMHDRLHYRYVNASVTDGRTRIVYEPAPMSMRWVPGVLCVLVFAILVHHCGGVVPAYAMVLAVWEEWVRRSA